MASIGLIGYMPPHVPNHQAGGIDPLNLALIAGQIVAGQHPAGLGVDLHHPQIHGAADHTDRWRYLNIPIQSFTPVQGAPALTQYGIYPNTYVGWAFDPGADETIYTALRLPQEWVSNPITLYSHWTINVAGAGAVQWGANIAMMATGESLVAAGTAVEGTRPVPGADLLSPFGGYAPGVAAASGDLIRICFRRIGTHIADTYANDAILVSAALNFYADM